MNNKLNNKQNNKLNNKLNNHQKYIRPDFVFSYWIFLWFILYKLKFINFNPKNALIFAIIINISMLGFLIKKKSTTYNIVKFIIINTIIKIIPFIFIYKSTVTNLDNYFFVVLFCLYIFWTHLNGKLNNKLNDNPYNNIKNKIINNSPVNIIYNELLFAYIGNDNKNNNHNQTNVNKKTPLSYYYDIIFNYLFDLI